MKLIFVHLILFLLVTDITYSQSKFGTCSKYPFDKKEDLKYLQDGYMGALERGECIEITDERKNRLIAYAKLINSYIINGQTDLLIANMSNDNFRYYVEDLNDDSANKDKSRLSKKDFLEKFKNGLYYYYLIFKPKGIKEDELKKIKRKYIDLRNFLQCIGGSSEWFIYYELKEKVYHVHFIIPNEIVWKYWEGPNSLYFHYVVSEENGKYVLVGF